MTHSCPNCKAIPLFIASKLYETDKNTFERLRHCTACDGLFKEVFPVPKSTIETPSNLDLEWMPRTDLK